MPKTFIMTMSSGYIPSDHWTQDHNVGGGRIIGEACHYLDLMRYLAGSKIVSFNAIKMGENRYCDITDDKAIITLSFEDGSVGSIHYYANGGSKYPKERIEVFCDNSVLQIENFKRMKGFGWHGFSGMNLLAQNKGHKECVQSFINRVKFGGSDPISSEELFEVAKISVEIAEILQS